MSGRHAGGSRSSRWRSTGTWPKEEMLARRSSATSTRPDLDAEAGDAAASSRRAGCSRPPVGSTVVHRVAHRRNARGGRLHDETGCSLRSRLTSSSNAHALHAMWEPAVRVHPGALLDSLADVDPEAEAAHVRRRWPRSTRTIGRMIAILMHDDAPPRGRSRLRRPVRVRVRLRLDARRLRAIGRNTRSAEPRPTRRRTRWAAVITWLYVAGSTASRPTSTGCRRSRSTRRAGCSAPPVGA